MAEKGSRTKSTENPSLPNPMFKDFATMGTKRIGDIVKAQTELFGKFQEANQHWLDRAQVEAKRTSELASKLMAARSIPDAMTAWQDWSNRCFEMMAEDGKQLFADSQKLAGTYTNFLSNGPGSISS